MKSVGMFNLAAVVASATVIAIAAVLVPEQITNNVALATLVIFALSVGFTFYVPSLLVRSSPGSDAAAMASIGMAATLANFLLILTAAAFCLALLQYERAAIAVDILAVGGLIVGGLIAQSALKVVDAVSSESNRVSNHVRWQGDIQAIASGVSDESVRRDVQKIGEALRYAASDVVGGSPHDAEIEAVIRDSMDLSSAENITELKSKIARIESLLSRREAFLRMARSKA